MSVRDELFDFYARETALLDDFRLHEWLDTLDDEIRYVMPMLETRLGPVPQGEDDGPHFYLFNDDKASLRTRVARYDTGLALVESPRSATQRLVTDLLVLDTAGAQTTVRTSFQVYQCRDEMNDTTFYGRRVDRLRRTAGGFKVLRRDIALAHYVLQRTISLFF